MEGFDTVYRLAIFDFENRIDTKSSRKRSHESSSNGPHESSGSTGPILKQQIMLFKNGTKEHYLAISPVLNVIS